MVLASRLLVAAAVAGLVVPPAWADVIPTQHAEESDAPAKVEARLAHLGVAAGEARERAASLSPEAAAYFAQDTNRLQAAGQEMWGGQSDNLWWEWLFGAAMLGGSIAALVVISND